MLRRAVLVWGLMVLGGLAWLVPGAVKADEDDWPDADNALDMQTFRLFHQGDYEAADAIALQLIKRHPRSAVALIDHIEVLDATGHFAEALAAGRKAAELDPTNFAVPRWIGISLVRLGRYAEAIAPLETSIKLDPYNNPASIWLAEAYLRTGDAQRSNQILEKLLQDYARDQQPDAMCWMAGVYNNIGNGEAAVTWWKRAAALGSKSAAQWLSWAYANGFGVPEDAGDGAYWSRMGDDSYPWLPRLSWADDWIKQTHGWVLVLMALASASILPIATIGVIGYAVGRGVTTDPAIHWTERARRSYPFQIFLGSCVILLPVLYAAASDYYPGSLLPISKQLLFWSVLGVGLISANWIVVQWARRYHEQPGSVWKNLLNLAVILFFYVPVFLIFGVMAAYLPSQWNVQAGLVLSAGILAYFWLQYGGWLRLGRILFLIIPGDQSLSAATRELALRWNRPEPTVWAFRWPKANALALPFCNAILVTNKLREILNPAEMKAVLAHEMAHLCEDRATRLMRLLTPLLLLPLFTLSLWWTDGNWTEFGACYVLIIAAFLLLRKRRRRMEERADTFGNQVDEDPQVYPRALAKLYEANHVPSVMPGKRKVHPHLYDRLIVAGITPDYPRPRAPRSWGVWAAFFTVGINLLGLAGIWLLLF